MTREHILAKLKAKQPDIAERYGVEIFGLVGSWARGEAGPDSDIDVVYRIIDREKFTSVPWSIGALWSEFQDMFGRKVDVIDWGGLAPRHKHVMEKDIIEFYG